MIPPIYFGRVKRAARILRLVSSGPLPPRAAPGGTTVSGRSNEIKGGLKEAAGKVFGDDGLEAEGSAQKDAGKAERKTSGAFHEAKGSVKAGIGDMIDSPT